MLIKIHSHGSGGGSGPTGYLMSEKDHAGKVREVAPEVLRGDPAQTREVLALALAACLNGGISETRYGVFRM